MTTVENIYSLDLPQKINIPSDICSECGGHILETIAGGDSVCENCGLVIEERKIDPATMERAYSQREREKKLRTGQPITPLVAHMSLSTFVKKKEIKNPDLKRAIKWDTRMDGFVRSLLVAISEIKRISANLSIPYSIQSNAVILYRKLSKSKFLRGRSLQNVVLACLFFACRLHNFPRNLQDLAEGTLSNKKQRRVMRCYKQIILETGENPKAVSPLKFLPRYISELDIKEDVEHLILQVYNGFISRAYSSGHSLYGILAGAIYFVTHHKKLQTTQKEISEVVGITEVTLRSKYKAIKSKIKFK